MTSSRNEMAKAKNIKTKKLKNKLLLAIIPVVIVIVAVLITISTQLTKVNLSRMAQAELESSATNQADNIVSWLNENLENFQTTKDLIENTNPDYNTLKKIIDSTYNYNKNSPEGMYMGSEEGRVIIPTKSKIKITDPTSEIWYKQGLSRVQMNYGETYKNSKGEYVISASGILNDKSGTIKVISADLSLNKISVIVNAGVKMKNASSFLIDTHDDVILAHRDSELVSKKISDISDNDLISGVAKKVSKRVYNDASIDGNLVTFQKISGTEWILVSYISEDIIYAQITKVTTILIIVGVVAVILLIILISLVVTKIIAPLSAITNNITAMANGDFTIKVHKSSNDEIGTMSSKVSEFVGIMREMITNINRESERLKEQSDNSNEVSQTMFDASQAQEEAMSGLNRTVDQLAQAVNEIAQNATVLAGVVADTRDNSQMAGESMKETIKLSEEGREDMEQLSNAMHQIQGANDQLVGSIGKVGDASEEITKIVGMISSIAEETNLLSLNASIEAARAGEAGKGFAVVASEIGNLANDSSDSAANIAKLINQVRELIQDVVNQANASAESIKENTELINQAVDTFDKIYENIQKSNELITAMVDGVDRVNDVASNVAAISEEQAASADEILATSENMVEEAESITRSSQDVAANSQELADTSVTLSEYVQRFKI
ncbi:methyl-accepting chemotaxis protein [Lachnobacterium bovis]|uniref:Methyl-accepting chemotaxis protein n=1 Tax=Lachnobacterium bovis TaxID=140626 RepID=A0A1H9SAF8_9FIRM|nr:methyl-accepting chemotaxis protein [Lachnobacterium bovis]SER82007.1 methyl-accepting chemotaxis protein [Lachnobacterium bovis]